MLQDGNIGPYKKIVVKCGKTDLRCGIASLTLQLSMLYNVDLNEKDVLYLFCGSSRDKIKGLVHMDRGFVLVNILLETDKVKWVEAQDSQELVEISEEQLQAILHGQQIDLTS